MSPKLLYNWFERIGFVEDSSSQHTETTVSNKNEYITKLTTDEISIPRFAKLQSETNVIIWFNQYKWFYLCRTQLQNTGAK